MDDTEIPANSNPQLSPYSLGQDSADTLHNPLIIPVGAQTGPILPSTSAEVPLQKPDPVKKPRKIVILIMIFAGLLIVAVAAFMILKSAGELKLVPHETDSSYFLVPESYEQIPQQSGQRFDEPDDNPNTKSSVIYIYQPYNADFTAEDKNAFAEMFRNQIPNFVNSFADNEGETIEDITTERFMTEEKNAVRARATLVKGEARANFDMIVVFGNQGLYALAVAAHDSDTNLKELNNTIINSLTVHD